MASIYLRGKWWWITFWLEGQKCSEPLKTTQEKKAERMKAAKELALEKGEVQRTRRVSFEKFLDDYEAFYLAAGGSECADSRQTSWNKNSHSLRAFEAFAGGRGVSRIDRVKLSLVEAFQQMRVAEGLANSTVNKDTRVLKAAWNYARKHEWVTKNPFEVVDPLPVPQEPIVFLEPGQTAELLAEVEGRPIGPLVATAVYAGLRVSELLSLEWPSIKWADNAVQVVNTPNFKTKSRKIRMVPLASELKEILSPLKKESGLCFPTEEGEKDDASNVGRRLKRIGKALGFYVTPHVLRRTFAMTLRKRGVPIEKISAWLGHSSIAVTERWYAGHSFDPEDTAIEILSFSTTAPALRVVEGGSNAERSVASSV